MPAADERVKILLDIVVKNQQELEKVKAEFTALKNTVSKLTTASDQTAKALQNISRNLTVVRRHTSAVHSAFRGLVWNIVRAEIVIRGFQRIVQGLIAVFKGTIESVEEFKQAIIGLAAVQTTLASAIVPKEDIGKYYQYAKEQAGEFYKQLLAISAQTPVTTQQLFRLVTILEAFGQEVDLTNQQAREGLLALANAIFVATQGQRLEVQLLQETRALLGQSNEQHAVLLQLLKAINPEVEEQLKLWREQGQLLPHLAELLYPFTFAASDLRKTWTGVTQAIKSAFEILKKEAFEDWFNKVTDAAVRFQQAIYNISTGQLGPLGEGIKNLFTSFTQGLEIIGAAFPEFIKKAETWKKILSVIGEIWKAIAATVAYLIGLIRTLIRTTEYLFEDFKALVKWVASGFKGGIDRIKADFQQARQDFESSLERIWEPIYDKMDETEKKKEKGVRNVIDLMPFVQAERATLNILSNAKKIKSYTLDSINAELEVSRERIRQFEQIQNKLIEGASRLGAVYDPRKALGANWLWKFDPASSKTWEAVFEFYAKQGDKTAQKILTQFKRTETYLNKEKEHYQRLLYIKELLLDKERINNQLIIERDKYEREKLTIQKQILDTRLRLATVEDEATKKVLQERLKYLRQELHLVDEIKKKEEENARIQKQLRQDEILNRLERLRKQIVSPTKKSPLEAWLFPENEKINQYRAQLAQLQRQALKEGLDVSEQVAEMEAILDKMETPWFQFSQNISNIMEGTFQRMEDLVTNWIADLSFDLDGLVKIFRRAAAEIVVEWLKMLIKMRVQSSGSNLLGGLLGAIPFIGGFFKGGGASGPVEILTVNDLALVPPYHKGGVVGNLPDTFRLVPASIFERAPRLHSGLLPNEFPAILERGEVVIPKNTPIGGQQNVFIIYAIDSQSFEEVVRRNPGAIVNVVMDNIKNNNELAYEIRGAL